MGRLLISIIIFALMTSGAEAAEDLYRDSRAIQDVANFRVENVFKEVGQTWIVAEIVPSPTSGQMIAQGAYIDADSGKLVEPPGSRFVVNVEGTYRVIATLAGEVKKKGGEYQWELKENSRDQEDRAVYSPFRGGGIVICRIHEGLERGAKFGEVTLLPSEWEKFVIPVLDYFRAHAEVFQPSNAAANRDQLLALIEDRNPLLAGFAFRSLVEARVLNGKDLQESLLKARGLRYALFEFLLLMSNTPQDQIEGLVNEVSAVISMNDSERLKGLALGAFSALSESRSEATRKIGLEVLDTLNKKWLPRSPVTDVDEYIISALTAAGLRERKHERQEKR